MLHKYKQVLESALGVGGVTAIIASGLMYNNKRKNDKKEKERILNKIEEINNLDCKSIRNNRHRESCYLDKNMTLKVLKDKLSKL